MFDSFRSRLVLSNLLITLAGLLVVVLVFGQVLGERSSTIRRRDLTAQSRLVAAQIEYLYRHRGTATDLQQLVKRDSEALKVRIIVVGPTGRQVLDSAERTPYYRGSWHPLDRTALRHAQSASRQLKSRSLVLFQSPITGTVHPADGGAVLLVASVGDVQPTLLSLGNLFLIVLGTALLVWLAIGLYFTFSISRPLLRITGATERMARGDYQTRVPASGDGEIACLAASFNDMARQIHSSDRVLKDFVANVSHDLRTPLTMIAGFSEALLDGTAREDELAESAGVIHEEALKMQRMVDELLQLARLESGLLNFHREPVEPRDFVREVIQRQTRMTDEARHAAIENRVRAGLPAIEIDRQYFERVLRNLLDNALRYTPPDGTITIRARELDGYLEFAVSDTGAGIAAADLPRIFERFYRSSKSRERSEGHSGLGLAIAREIVEAHGGEITVESVVGEGTTFRFTVPLARRHAPPRDVPVGRESIQRPAI